MMVRCHRGDLALKHALELVVTDRARPAGAPAADYKWHIDSVTRADEGTVLCEDYPAAKGVNNHRGARHGLSAAA
jgi:hypothetical protein